MKNRWTALIAVLAFGQVAWGAAELEKLTNVVLVANHPANDGDSFIVQAGDRQLHLRLYFVDCPETVVSTDADAKRVRDQAGYFGLTNVAAVIEFGRAAQAFTAKALARPFTVYTAYANALGRSPTKRFYAFLVTGDGKDLAAELVENGLARAFGTKRSTPDGTSSTDMAERLHKLEAQALMKRVGAWQHSDPDEVIRQRAVRREEEQQFEELRHLTAKPAASPEQPVDLNTATSQQLQAIPGIGVVLAARIIAGRPYQSVDDLLRVTGISSRLFAKVRPYVVVRPAPGKSISP
jgi:DNA uptake protein ComE-like DNA-binding protein